MFIVGGVYDFESKCQKEEACTDDMYLFSTLDSEGMMLTKREDSLSHDVHHPIPFCPSHFSLPFAGAGFNFFFLLFDGETVEAARQV
jgi:hypothetical protein